MGKKDPISSRFELREKQHKLDELAQKGRTREEIEEEKQLLEKTKKVDPIHGEQAPGRNDPCPCGSGKKYKKCCFVEKK
jgi:uncharacterized protein YecA (UPF0149 family)